MIVELSQGDLNPCYHCGATEQDDDVHVCYVDEVGVAGYIVQCDKCGVTSNVLYQDRESAVDDWNAKKIIRVVRGNPIAHCKLNNNDGFSFDGEICSSMHRAAVQYADMLDTAVVNEALKVAKEAGISDLYLLDKQFVIDALTEKIQREKERMEK